MSKTTSGFTTAFIGVLRRREAGEDLARLHAKRVAQWNKLGKELAAVGWHHLEAALDLARRALDAAAPSTIKDPGYQPVASEEAERLAAAFADDCRRIIAAGGAEDLRFVLVTANPLSPLVDVVSAELLRDGDTTQIALFIDACRCFALAALTTCEGSDRMDARLLFGPEPGMTARYEAAVDEFAPFAPENTRDDSADRLWDAARSFASAKTSAEHFAAVRYYVAGLEEDRPLPRSRRCSAWGLSRGCLVEGSPSPRGAAGDSARQAVRRQRLRVTRTARCHTAHLS